MQISKQFCDTHILGRTSRSCLLLKCMLYRPTKVIFLPLLCFDASSLRWFGEFLVPMMNTIASSSISVRF